MTQRSKLELQINQPTVVELLYDEPITGTSKYGNYFMYAVGVDGTEYSFFPVEEVHEQIKHLRRGDKFIITKLAAQRGNKIMTRYVVEFNNPESKEPLNIPNEEESIPEPNGKDGLYEIMLRSYRDAVNIQTELGTFVDTSRIAITLFIARSKTSVNGSV